MAICDAQNSVQIRNLNAIKTFSCIKSFGLTMTPLQNQLAVNSGPTGNLSLVMAIVWIINNDYAKYTTTAVTMGQFSRGEEKQRFHYDLMDEVLKKATTYRKHDTESVANIKFIIEGETGNSNSTLLKKLFNNLSDEELFKRDYDNRDKAIWFLDSLESFDRLESNLLRPRSHYHRSGNFCIIYTGRNSDRLVNIKRMFQRLFALYVTNINVIIMIGRTPFAYTYFPFDRTRCQASTPTLWASFAGIVDNADFQLDKPFFPHKLDNMQGCKLAVATWPLPPMMFIEKSGNETHTHGIEGNILNLLAERMNFSIEVIMPPDGRGQIFENGTATGALKSVLDGKANITISNYLYDKIRSTYLQPSQTYLNIPLVVAVPSGRPMSPFVRLTRPFKYIIWSCLSSSVLCGALIILSIKVLNATQVSQFVFGHLNRIPLTNLWNTLFGGSIHGILPRRNFARYLLAIWLLYTLVLRNAYVGELFIILQDGRPLTTIQSIAEVVSLNYTIHTARTLEQTLKHSLGSANLEFIDTTKKNMLVTLFRDLQYYDAKKVVLTLGPTVRYYNRHLQNRSERVNALREILLMIPITMYMRPHSYLKRHINDILMNMMSSGLIMHSESIYLENDDYDLKRIAQIPHAISLSLLMGLFSVYFSLLILCSLVFLLELCTNYSPIARSVIHFFNC